jgi:hypothetical protein
MQQKTEIVFYYGKIWIFLTILQLKSWKKQYNQKVHYLTATFNQKKCKYAVLKEKWKYALLKDKINMLS